MKPLRRARTVEETERGLRLEFDDGVSCRISFLLSDLARVLYLRNGAPVARRTWMVPAYGSADTPWEGRDRLDDTPWPDCEVTRMASGDSVVLTTEAVNLTIMLAPFALAWALPDGRVFARERAAHATALGRSAMRHAFVRGERDRFYGLGDKTGRLDLHGRRLRTAMMDSLGFDPERGDPLYKHWPFLIARDGETGVASGVFYDNMTAATFDLGCEHDNYYGPYRSYEARGGDLDYYVFPGPDDRRRDAKVPRAHGPPALCRRDGALASPRRRWRSPTATTRRRGWKTSSRNAPPRTSRSARSISAPATPRSGAGVTSSPGTATNIPDPKALHAKFHAAGMRVVANLKPCLLDDHPLYDEAEVGRRLRRRRGRRTGHLAVLGRRGRAYRLHQPRRRRMVAARTCATVCSTSAMDAAWNDNNEYELSNEDAVCARLRRADAARSRAAAAAAPDDARLARRAAPARPGRAAVQRHPRRLPGDPALCADLERRQPTSWRSLKWNLRTGLQMSMSGMFNIGHDVGGFSGPAPDAELLVRWTQAGLLHPRFVMNSWKPDGVYTSPWLHPEATPAIREAIRLRYRLMPYLYSLMHAATDGEAVLRPTFVAFPSDETCAEDNDELMLGPVPARGSGRRAGRARPPGLSAEGARLLVRFLDRRAFSRRAPTTTLAAPLDRLPLVVPEGAILPMTDAGDDFSRLHDEPTRAVRIFPGPTQAASRFVARRG